MAKKQPKKRRAADIKALRACPESLSLTINGHGADWELEVLRPVNARDELAMPVHPKVITQLISYLQHAGFSEDLSQENKNRRIPHKPTDEESLYASWRNNALCTPVGRSQTAKS